MSLPTPVPPPLTPHYDQRARTVLTHPAPTPASRRTTAEPIALTTHDAPSQYAPAGSDRHDVYDAYLAPLSPRHPLEQVRHPRRVATSTYWLPVPDLFQPQPGVVQGTLLRGVVTTTPDPLHVALHRLDGQPSRLAGTVHLDHNPPLDAAFLGEVQHINAVECPHLLGEGGICIPNLRQLRSRSLTSTTDPLPSRSIWPASGEPVLIGYLLQLTLQHSGNTRRPL